MFRHLSAGVWWERVQNIRVYISIKIKRQYDQVVLALSASITLLDDFRGSDRVATDARIASLPKLHYIIPAKPLLKILQS